VLSSSYTRTPQGLELKVSGLGLGLESCGFGLGLELSGLD